MKSPDEIKKGLECCCDLMGVMCPYCPYAEDGDASETCKEEMAGDALVLIQQLQAENAEQTERIRQLEAERDAAVFDLKGYILKPRKVCSLCKNRNKPICNMCEGCDVFEWRGVQKEE